MDTKATVFVLVTMVTLFHLAAMASASKPHRKCPFGVEYYNREQKSCVPCSSCTGNTVPHRQCHGNQDTLCLPLGRFDFPNSGKKVAEPFKPEQSSVTLRIAPEARQETATTLLMADESSDEKWFTITMVLAGIMVVICIAGAFLLLFTCYICKKKQREIIYDSTFAGSLLSYDGNPEGKMELYKIVTET